MSLFTMSLTASNLEYASPARCLAHGMIDKSGQTKILSQFNLSQMVSRYLFRANIQPTFIIADTKMEISGGLSSQVSRRLPFTFQNRFLLYKTVIDYETASLMMSEIILIILRNHEPQPKMIHYKPESWIVNPFKV